MKYALVELLAPVMQFLRDNPNLSTAIVLLFDLLLLIAWQCGKAIGCRQAEAHYFRRPITFYTSDKRP